MDSNVSKKTFLHKFFKLGFNNQKTSLSVKELLKQTLLSTLDLSQQNSNISFNPLFVSHAIGSKIVLLHSSIESISSSRQSNRVLFTSKYTSIVYSSSIALLLASLNKKTSQAIAQELIGLLVLTQNYTGSQAGLNLTIKIMESGLINFHLDDEFIAMWLNKSLVLLNNRTTISSPNLFPIQPLDSVLVNLFPAQYVHARCCTLLNLAAREKLFISNKDSQNINWLDEEGNLWLTTETEFLLLRHLFLVADSFASESANWYKLAINLSEITVIFLAECRFLGELQQDTPQKAIARLKINHYYSILATANTRREIKRRSTN